MIISANNKKQKVEQEKQKRKQLTKALIKINKMPDEKHMGYDMYGDMNKQNDN